jgi:hypothetical protein
MRFDHRLGIVLVALLSLAGGCIRLETTLTIAPDGSGSAIVYGAIRQQALDRLLLAQSLAADLHDKSPTNSFMAPSPSPWLMLLSARDGDQAWRLLQSYATPTLEFQRRTFEIKQDRRDLFFEIRFHSLEDLVRCPLFQHLSWRVQNLKDGSVRCALTFPPLDFGADLAMLPIDLSPFLTDLNITFNIQTPSEILETNGHRSTARTARWQFNYDRDPRELRQLDRASVNIIFASTGHPFPTISTLPIP